jgi:hypothetical protein
LTSSAARVTQHELAPHPDIPGAHRHPLMTSTHGRQGAEKLFQDIAPWDLLVHRMTPDQARHRTVRGDPPRSSGCRHRAPGRVPATAGSSPDPQQGTPRRCCRMPRIQRQLRSGWPGRARARRPRADAPSAAPAGPGGVSRQVTPGEGDQPRRRDPVGQPPRSSGIKSGAKWRHRPRRVGHPGRIVWPECPIDAGVVGFWCSSNPTVAGAIPAGRVHLRLANSRCDLGQDNAKSSRVRLCPVVTEGETTASGEGAVARADASERVGPAQPTLTGIRAALSVAAPDRGSVTRRSPESRRRVDPLLARSLTW